MVGKWQVNSLGELVHWAGNPNLAMFPGCEEQGIQFLETGREQCRRPRKPGQVEVNLSDRAMRHPAGNDRVNQAESFLFGIARNWN
jgi:hypothetical protein